MHAAAFVLLAMIRQAGSLQLFMPPREVAAKSRLVSGLDVAASSDGERVAWCEGMHGYDGACYVWMRGAMAPRSAQPFKEEVGGSVMRYVLDGADSIDQYDFSLKFVRESAPLLLASLQGTMDGSRLVVENLTDEHHPGVARAHRCQRAEFAGVPWRDGALIAWADCSNGMPVFRARTVDHLNFIEPAVTLPPCCPTPNSEFTVLAMPHLSFVLIYAGRLGHGFDGISELVMYADDFSTWREFAVSPHSPRHIAACALHEWKHVIVWDDAEGIHAAVGEIAKPRTIVTIAKKGSSPSVATDGVHTVVLWQDGGKVLAADLDDVSKVQMLDAAAMVSQPFLKVLWSQQSGFVAYWRRDTAPGRLEVARQELSLAPDH